jgi:hypothetical protein
LTEHPREPIHDSCVVLKKEASALGCEGAIAKDHHARSAQQHNRPRANFGSEQRMNTPLVRIVVQAFGVPSGPVSAVDARRSNIAPTR